MYADGTVTQNEEQDFSGTTVMISLKAFVFSEFSRPSLSLRSTSQRIFSCTKSGCDVHTNEPIIAGFVSS